MLLHSVSNLSCSAKCIQAFSFELTPLLKKYWTLIQKVYSTFICQCKIFNFNLIFEAWISKHTIVQHQSRVCLYWNEFHGIDVRIPEHSATSAAFSSGLWGPHVRHPTLNRAPLINGPLVDRQFPPLLQGVELRSRGAECKRRLYALSLGWPHSREAARSQRTKASSQLSKQGSQLFPPKNWAIYILHSFI